MRVLVTTSVPTLSRPEQAGVECVRISTACPAPVVSDGDQDGEAGMLMLVRWASNLEADRGRVETETLGICIHQLHTYRWHLDMLTASRHVLVELTNCFS